MSGTTWVLIWYLVPFWSFSVTGRALASDAHANSTAAVRPIVRGVKHLESLMIPPDRGRGTSLARSVVPIHKWRQASARHLPGPLPCRGAREVECGEHVGGPRAAHRQRLPAPTPSGA